MGVDLTETWAPGGGDIARRLRGADLDHVRADQALRDSEERLRAFVAASADVVYRMSPDWSEMRQLEGRNFLRDTGTPDGDWIDSYIHPEDQAMVRAAIERAIRTRTVFQLDHRVIRVDGSFGFTRSRAVPILNDRGAIKEWLGTASDVTEARAAERARAQAEARSQQAETRYLALFNAIDQGFCTIEVKFDAQDRPLDYRFLEVSPSFERQTGIADAAGRWMREIAPDEDQRWFDVYGDVARTGQPARLEHSSTPLGRWWEVFAFRIENPADRRVGVLFRDITARKQADVAARHREERQAFLLTLSDALRVLAAPDDIQREACRALAEQLGVDRAYYVEIDEAAGTARVQHDFVGEGVRSLAGEHRVADFGWSVEILRRGECPVVADTRTSAMIPDAARAALAALGVVAGLGAPLIKAGQLVGALCVADAAPREWGEHDVALLREVAERIWEAVERARAAVTLRDRESELAHTQRIGLVASVDVVLTDPPVGHRSPEYRRLHGLPPDHARESHEEWLARIHPDDRARENAEFVASIEAGDVFESEYRIIRPSDGQERWIGAKGVIERDAQGRATRMVGVHIDVTDRKHVDAALRESEERQVFLLKLSDALRPLEDAAEIERTAVDLLGAKLGVSRAFYATIESDGDTIVVEHAYADGVAAGLGRYSLAAFRPGRVPEWQAGHVTMTNDSETDPSFGDVERAAYASVSSRAAVSVPLVKRGRLVALLAVNQATPRVWTDQETSLIVDVAERVWLAVDRARSEAALAETQERLRQFGEASQDVLWIRDAESFQWEYLTPAFETIYGLDREAALRGDNMAGWLELIVPEDRAHAAQSLRRVHDGEWVTFEYRIRRPVDGGIRWLRNTDFPIQDASGKVVRIGGIGHDITELKHAEAAIAASGLRLRTLMEGIPQLVWRSCDLGLWTWASPQWLSFTGQTPEESHDRGWLAAIHPDDRAITMRAWHAARSHGMLDVEFRVRRTADNAWIWHHTRSVPVRIEDGSIVEWLGTSTDIQNLRELQARQEVLVTELQHRTFNLLSVVRSMADATLRSSTSLDTFKAKFRDRIEALARVQRLLSRLKDGDRITFDELIRGELTAAGALQEDDGRVTLDGPDGVALRSGTVQTFAMAIHELTTNALKYGALKYGAPKQPDAHLDIRWRVETEADEQAWLHVDWRETGVDVVLGEAPRGTGQGRALIEEALPYQLRARTSYVIASDGVRCSIALPVTQQAWVGSDSPDG